MKKQSGFTLIEIVMVLVLLGILTAVAVPKYFDLQKEASERAAATFAAEYQARINAEFAKELLGGSTCTESRKAAIKNVNTEENSNLISDSKEKNGVKAISETLTGAQKVTVYLNKEEFTDAYTIQLPTCSKEDPVKTP